MSRLATFALLSLGLQQVAARGFNYGGAPNGYGGPQNGYGGPQGDHQGGPPEAYGGESNGQHGPPQGFGGPPEGQHGPPAAYGGAQGGPPFEHFNGSAPQADHAAPSASSAAAPAYIPAVNSSAVSSSVAYNTTTTVLHTDVVTTECANSSSIIVSQSVAGALPTSLDSTTTVSPVIKAGTAETVSNPRYSAETTANPAASGYPTQAANGSSAVTSALVTSSPVVTVASATTTLNASSVVAVSPNGGILSIPPSATAPVQSLLATFPQCEALMDNKLPGKNSIPSNFQFSGNVRTYYVAAEEVTWNYAPSGWDNWLGVPVHQSPRAAAGGYLNVSGSIGQNGGLTWQKAAYRGYTDATFTQQTEQHPGDGLNGPTLRGEVNDMIQILFVNNLEKNYASMHSMGLYYGKEYEGSLYPNTTTGGSPPVQEQDAVPPGGCAVYKWIIAESQAPAPGQDSRLWSYHSYVNMAADITAGLVGPTIVYNQGKMAEVMAGNREFIMNYATYYEAESWLAGKNAELAGLTGLQSRGGLVGGPHIGNESYYVPQLINNPDVILTEQQAPIFYTLNGYVLANGYPYEMCRNDPVIWYVMSYGNYAHVFHMHGNNFQVNGLSPWQATLNLNVGEMFTLNMAAQLPGVWQVICHVAMHLVFGMEQNYQVHEIEEYGGSCPLPPLTQKLTGSA